MNILVLDVAASESGALTILKEYYEKAKRDLDNQYLFCVSTTELESVGNVKVLTLPWTKKSWLHRLWFELVTVNKIVKSNDIQCVFSLQNLIIRDVKCEKWIYLHNTIPFTKVKFSPIKDTKMWVYKQLVGKLMISSLKKADKIIVQTGWMKEACIEKTKVKPEIIEVNMPEIDTKDIVVCEDRNSVKKKFFYPATAFKYKNHMRLLEAVRLVYEQCQDFEVNLTLSGNENERSKAMYEYVNEHKLPVNFLGYMPRERVMEYYSTHTLIFPSYIETFGLPLLEARLSNTMIIASDCAFSNEILRGYDAVTYFDPFDVEKISKAIIDSLEDS